MSCRRWCRNQQSEPRDFLRTQVYGRNRGEAKVCMATLHPQPSLSKCPARDFFDGTPDVRFNCTKFKSVIAKAVGAHVSYRAALWGRCPRVEKLHREIALVGLANHVVAGILTVSTICHLCPFASSVMLPFGPLTFAILAFSFAQKRLLCPLVRWNVRLFLFSAIRRTTFVDARRGR